MTSTQPGTRTGRWLARALLAVAFISICTGAFAQGAVLQGGPWGQAHIPQYVGPGGNYSQPVVKDGGNAGGGAIGSNPSELGLTELSPTNTYPAVNAGHGPSGTNFCLYDAPTTNATGYHYLCLGPNAAGGGLMSYGAGGTATPLPFNLTVNGIPRLFPAENFVSNGTSVDVSQQTSVAAAIATGKNLYFPSGSYTLTGGSVTILPSQSVTFAAGATLSCSGTPLTIQGAINAPRTQMFASGCVPVFTGNANLGTIYPEWWGADPTGVGDYAVGLNSAITAANSAGGGNVAVIGIGQTLKLSQTVTLRSNAQVQCYGRPTLMLNAGVNDTVLEGLNFKTLVGTNSGTAGISSFIVRDCVFDGNAANNTSPPSNGGHGIAFVGRDFLIDNVTVQDVYRTCVWTEYASQGGGTSPENGNVRTLTTNNCGENGWYNRVSDLHADGVNARNAALNASSGSPANAGIWLDPNGSIRGSNINVWDSNGFQAYSLFVNAGSTHLTNVHLESGYLANLLLQGGNNQITNLQVYDNNGGAGTYGVWVLGNDNDIRGQVFPYLFGNLAATGIKLGGTFNTTLYSPVGTKLDVDVENYTGGLIDWTNDGGNTRAELYTYLSAGCAAAFIGTAQVSSEINSLGTCATNGSTYQSSVAYGNGTSATQTQCTAVGYNTQCKDFYAAAYGAYGVANQQGNFDVGLGKFTASGSLDHKVANWFGTTTNATPTEIFVDGVALRAAPIYPSSWLGDFYILGHRTDSVHALVCAYRISNFASSKSNSGVVSIGNAGTSTGLITSGCSAPSVGSTAGNLTMTVTGSAGETINWEAQFIGAQIGE